MNSGCDSLDGSKHERVVQALEQVNGFRYRYKPAPQEGKKMLRFDSDEEDSSDAEDDDEAASDDEAQRRLQQRSKQERVKHTHDESDTAVLTLDDHIENLLRKTRTLAMLKIANNTANFITEKLLGTPDDQFDDEDYADLIDCHVDSARDDETHTKAEDDDPIWKRRQSDLSNPFNEEEYIMWRTQVKADYLAWLNAKVEATKHRKSRVKKVDPNKKPRWLLLYEASMNPTSKYRPDSKA
ncbi:hypothetical protein BBO99_00005817 [Phytophthora kernoviae]|uniref:Uncharacterized protein n=2 Tax=Phytophthora kernoviae TaxID=325452 RepID=A0A3R7JYF2_9STRA|nr:hypothetical protein G195_006534 [Phytophthora kernoviae 00238/432]KAG2523097.1 hypothetical protein JM16_005485 [Phytophthora kernoviae]KAG2524818.1 hypothetical protein JM18_005109 [Phytophthora kernoviae]RLN05996.1 hypothetical protein BBI17_005882 [Phytophthora kernoviae]RLN78673.1 hypothetical protein BBO99_00005817 [Phytophthora kernoviae]